MERIIIAGYAYKIHRDADQVMSEDGTRVAVAVSVGYGAGWSTWGGNRLATDPRVITAVLEKRSLTKKEYEALGKPYMGGFNDLTIQWLPSGQWIRIEEYDGAEGIAAGWEGRGIFLRPSQEVEREKALQKKKAEHEVMFQRRAAAALRLMHNDTGSLSISFVPAEGDDILREVFHVHPAVAKASCPAYFNALLSGGFMEGDTRASVIETPFPHLGRQLVHFMHHGSFQEGFAFGSDPEKEETLRIADMLDFRDLVVFLQSW